MALDLDIRNYYEHLVADEIHRMELTDVSPELFADVMCLALNQLPAKYIRHEVDMAFYMPQNERLEMQMRAREAVERAVRFLQERAQRLTP
ncbi:MAG: late competence development ComFB family protein [Corallincola sp.]|nr:late competence development ComFB family protein [Corallincola sp.]